MEPDIKLAKQLFDELARTTADMHGVTRESYGAGEDIAHQLVRKAGLDLGLEVTTDFAGNSYMTLAGQDRDAPVIVSGSHLDSVREGGNFDGAAGVISGLCAISGLQKAGVRLSRDFVVAAWRAEEGCWFPQTWLGSRMALGKLSGDIIDELLHVDTGVSLGQHLDDLGLASSLVRSGARFLEPKNILCFLEAHIEQGPVLDSKSIPVGIVTTIMGGPRYRQAKILGRYSHAGGTPRVYRNDSIVALAELVTRVNGYWKELERRGQDAVFTFGVVHTDRLLNAFSRVAGSVEFCFDARFADPRELELFRRWLLSLRSSIEETHGVEIDLGDDTGPKILPMDLELRSSLTNVASVANIKTIDIASGAGHDAGVFIECEVPTAMIFIRNKHGSHNADESMDFNDFRDATRVLMGFIANTHSG